MNHQMNRIAFALSLFSIGSIANATMLPPESITANVDIVAGAFGGTLLDTAITAVANTSYNGIARSAVYDTGSGLDFYFQYTNDLSSVNGIERFTAYNFAGVGSAAVINVFQTATPFGIFAAGTESADYADRTALGVVGFSFVPNGHSKVNPGTTSYTQIIRTNARDYTLGSFGLLDGIGDNAHGFAPAVPEPSTSTLMLLGLGICGFVARRRMNKA